MAGGNITEIAGGKIILDVKNEYNVYADKININTDKLVKLTGDENGVFLGNKPLDPPPLTPEKIRPKCIVQFRPHGNWQGEFGFDWLRTGDSGLEGDKHWIKKILGKHYVNNTYSSVFADTNSWSTFFKEDPKMYDKMLTKEFSCLSIAWKSIKGKPYLYAVPVVTLIPNDNEAKLSLKMEIEELPGELIIKPRRKDTGVVFNTTTLVVKKGKYNLNNYLTVKCTKPLTADLLVDVLADNEICGQFKILANDEKHIRKIDVLIVSVRTLIGTSPNKGTMVAGGEAFFKQNLKQAMVIPNIRYLIKPLDLSSGSFKATFSTGGNISNSNGLLDFLDAAVESTYSGKYANFYKLYFIGETYPSPVNPRLITQGFSYFNTKHGVFFNFHNKSTISHETLHALGLPHTFDGINVAAKYTYKAQETDNIMDYCHWSNDISGNPRKPVVGKTLFKWQWKIVNP